MRCIVLCSLFVLAPLAGCEEEPAIDLSRRDTAPPEVILPRRSDPEMEQAITRARSELPAFIETLQKPGELQVNFSIKAKFTEGDEDEMLWITPTGYDNNTFHGTVETEPLYLKNIQAGQSVEVPAENVADWMYVEEGRLIGGYTIRVTRSRLSGQELEDFDRAWGFRFD